MAKKYNKENIGEILKRRGEEGYEKEEYDDEEGSSQTPLPSKKTKFGFDEDSVEGGIGKLFLNALGKLGEKNPEEAFSVIEHLLTALGGASASQSGVPPIGGTPPGQMPLSMPPMPPMPPPPGGGGPPPPPMGPPPGMGGPPPVG